MCLPAGSFSVAGGVPTNAPSTKDLGVIDIRGNGDKSETRRRRFGSSCWARWNSGLGRSSNRGFGHLLDTGSACWRRNRLHAGFFLRGRESWIEMGQYIEKIASAKRKADAGDVLLDQFQRVQANDFAAGVDQRPAGIAGIDGRVGLDPSAGTSGRKFTDDTYNSFRHAEEHSVTRIPDHQNRFALLDQRGYRQARDKETRNWGRVEQL